MKDLQVLSRLLYPADKNKIANDLSVSPRTIEAVLQGRRINTKIMSALVDTAEANLQDMVKSMDALRNITGGKSATIIEEESQPGHSSEKEESISAVKTELRPRSRESLMSIERLSRQLTEKQRTFIATFAPQCKIFSTDVDILEACFTLHMQGYSKGAVTIFINQHHLVPDINAEEAYNSLQHLFQLYFRKITGRE